MGQLIAGPFAGKTLEAIVRALALEADVLIENFKPGTLESWGLEAVMREIERVPGGVYTALVPNVRGGERALACGTDEFNLVKLALGDLGKVEAVLKVLGMVNAAPEFIHHPKVIDGFSDVIVTAFGDAGRHARSAVGMGSLPHGMPVEVEAILLIRD